MLVSGQDEFGLFARPHVTGQIDSWPAGLADCTKNKANFRRKTDRKHRKQTKQERLINKNSNAGLLDRKLGSLMWCQTNNCHCQGCGVGFFVRLRMSDWIIFYIALLNGGIPVEMVQFLLKLLLKPIACCAPRFH